MNFDMADSSTATMPFRFLDLPPELRNNIYSRLLEDSSPSSVDLLNYNAHVQARSILATCKQIRQELSTLLTKAQLSFWKHHSWTINFDERILDSMYRDYIMSRCEALPKSARIKHLIFLMNVQNEFNRSVADLTIEAKVHTAGIVRWTVGTNSKGNAARLASSANLAELIIEMKAAPHRLHLADDKEFLDVQACAKFFCDWNEAESSFSSRVGIRSGNAYIHMLCCALGYLRFGRT